MITPTRIEPLKTGDTPTELFLQFSNGEEYALAYPELRFHCPCAGCVDEHTGKRIIRREQIQPGVRPTGVQTVGRYALQINWSDRHATGMYHFDQLYKLSQTLGRRLK